MTELLNSKTKIGLNFSELISIIFTVAMVVGIYFALSVRITELEKITSELEKGRIQNAINIETMRKENREEHSKMMDKLDVVIINLKR